MGVSPAVTRVASVLHGHKQLKVILKQLSRESTLRATLVIAYRQFPLGLEKAANERHYVGI